MATGIEMLGQMGTDQSLAGPVQGGNMVVKPNQVPVGGAAMLAKALRGQANKGVGGMYVLPEQQDQTPEFMKIAQSNVMRDIEGQRNQYPGNFSEAEGGIIPMLPRNLKTAPGADETTLAYITPEEQAILGLLNHGTPHMGPEQVPSYDSYDYGTYTTSEDWSDFETGGGSAPAAYQEAHQAAVADTSSPYHEQAVQEQNIIDTYGDTYAGFEQAAQDQAAGTTTTEEEEETVDETVSTTVSEVGDKINKLELNENEKLLVSQAQAELTKGNQAKAQRIIDSINSAALNSIFEGYSSKKDDDKKTKDKKKKGWGTILSAITNPASFGLGIVKEALSKPSKDDILAKLKAGESLNPQEQNIAAGLKLANVGNPDVLTKEQLKMIEEGAGFTSDDKIKQMIESYRGGEKMGWTEGLKALGKGGAIRPDGSISLEGLTKGLSRADKRLMKDIDPEMWAKLNFANTSGGHESLGKQQYIKNKIDADGNKIALTDSEKAFNRSVMESREIAGRDREEQRGQRPTAMGGGTAPVVEDEVTEAVVEEGATTMPYTGPRTGGAEVNVPLSRRFALDPTQDVAQYKTAPRSTEDIYKYFTEGTTGEGRMLEPYGEFQKRRRKALGKKPLDFWSY